MSSVNKQKYIRLAAGGDVGLINAQGENNKNI